MLLRHLILAAMLLATQLAWAPAAWADETRALLVAVNATRARSGLDVLRDNPQLRLAAAELAADLPRCGRLSHQGCDGSDLRERLVRAGYPFAFAAENLAHGTPNAAETLAAWLESPGHRENLLRPELREAGIAQGELQGQTLWVMVLGSRR
ncbi:CAP domain-containing protein [Ferrovibrio sp. MS7]|uniref:CAP domain-containing protein n=1 Tax=Ferrovibrio plantarum TaxID=3119164 RepID=UPI003134FF82